MLKNLEDYLYRNIPLSRAMCVSVLEISERSVLLGAPLAPNINHQETAFGGSLSTLAILSAWSLVHTRLASADLPGRVVIQRNSFEYLEPVDGNFTARATLPEPGDWPRFAHMLARRGKARLTVQAVLEQDGRVCGLFSGEFVALTAPAAPPI
ncbi:MAG TPA: thioesterase domain-containing protein [Acetobacteraceae bacterium]|nr:thioesterase domain-containing protein [Acetobacteraceae bacterium]